MWRRPRASALALALIVVGLALIGAAGSRRTLNQTVEAHLVVHGRNIALTVPGASSQDWASIWHWDDATRSEGWLAGLSLAGGTFTGRLPAAFPTTMIWAIHRGTAYVSTGDIPDGFDQTITLGLARSPTSSTVPAWLTPVAYLLVACLLGCAIIATELLLNCGVSTPLHKSGAAYG